MSPLQTKIDRARWHLLNVSPFWGSLAMQLRDELRPTKERTAATDGKRIAWTPDFLERLTPQQTNFVLLHEVAHCALGHFWRLPVGDPLAQMAADYVVNRMLTEAPGLGAQMVKGALLDPQFDKMAEEEILAELRKRALPADEITVGCGAFEAGGEEEKKLQEVWERAVIIAVQQAQAAGCGDVPGEFSRLAEACTAPPVVDWRQETADFLWASIEQRNNWSRSARRHAWQPVIYPRRHQRVNVGLVVAVRDTSGSISNAELGEFNALLEAAQQELGCPLLVVDCDAAIAREVRVEPGGELPADMKGGGGTDLRPPFERVRQLVGDGETVAGVIYMTDLGGPEPEPSDVTVPTLWLCTMASKAKTGRTVAIRP